MKRYKARQAILRADPRLKALLVLWTGIMVWQAGLPGALLYMVGTGALAVLLSGHSGLQGFKWRLLLIPIAFWVLFKALLECLEPRPFWPEGALETSLLGTRLLVLLLLGLVLAWATSGTQLGLAVNWFLRPVLGRSRSWQGALALSLMLHFIPLTLSTLSRVRQSIWLRIGDLPLHTRLVVWVRTTLRVLSGKTWDQTLALAARKLDQPGAWEGIIPFRFQEWAAGGLAAGLVFSLSLL